MELRVVVVGAEDFQEVPGAPLERTQFHGSFSLKKIVPALVPNLRYEDLDIQNGDDAKRAYIEALKTTDPTRRKLLHKQLLAYCRRDTLAMVEVRRALAKAVNR